MMTNPNQEPQPVFAPHNIPSELRALPQWVLWKKVPRGNEFAKMLFDAKTRAAASVSERTTWSTFEECLKVITEYPQLGYGLGFVFTKDDPYVGIDLDDALKAASAEERARIEQQLNLLDIPTYSERSPSGRGLHIICRGTLPGTGRRVESVQMEIYDTGRYFTFTGDVFNNRFEITDQQELVTRLHSELTALQQRARFALVRNNGERAERPTGLTDQEVLLKCAAYNPKFAPAYNCQIGHLPGEWSETFMMVLGIIDLHTGDYEQLRRLILQSPLARNAPNSTAGETRLHKAEREIDLTNEKSGLNKIRDGNDVHIAEVIRGQGFANAILSTEAKKAEEKVRQAEAEVGQDFLKSESVRSKELLDWFPLEDEYKRELRYPPGVVGMLVRATEAASIKPFIKYAIPTTLSVLSGMVGRAFKINDMGLNLNFIIAGSTHTGKSEAQNAWVGFMQQVDEGNMIPYTPIIQGNTASIQAMFSDFSKTGSGVWFSSEAAGLVQRMFAPKTNTDEDLKDAYNDLYDKSKTYLPFEPPRSIRAQRSEKGPAIYNLSMSTCWTMPESKFDMGMADALDGYLSRTIIVRHSGPSSDIRRPSEVQRTLPQDLLRWLKVIHGPVASINQNYELIRNANSTDYSAVNARITSVSDVLVADIVWGYMQLVDMVANIAITEGSQLPAGYVGISRVVMNAQRMAATLAVFENPNLPSITVEQFKWSLGYCFQQFVQVMSDTDTGEIGDGANDEVMAIVRAMRKIVTANKEYKKLKGAPISKVRQYAKERKPFHLGVGSKGRSQRVTDTINHMLSEGMLTKDEMTIPGTCLLKPTNDEVWKS